MNAEHGQSFLVEYKDPEHGETQVDERKEEVYSGEDGPTRGEIIPGTGFTVKVVHCGADVHGYEEVFRVTVSENEGILIGVGFDEEGPE